MHHDKAQKKEEILNPCNKFIIQFLIKLRQQDNNNSKFIKSRFRSDHHYQIYSRAINSIKKYPMPIICQDQLNTIAGVGDCLRGKLIQVIKEYYKRFLKHCNNTSQSFNTPSNIQENYDASKIISWKQSISCSSIKSNLEDQAQDNGDDDNISEKRDKISMLLYRNKNVSDCDSKSSRSQNIMKRVNEYRPRQGTQSSNVLKVLKILQAEINPVTKKDIDKCLLENNYEKTKQWKNCKEQLQKNGYISVSVDQEGENEEYFLTSKGLQYIQNQQELQQSNFSRKKMQLSIESFKQKFLSKEKQELTLSQSQTFSINSIQPSQTKSKNKSLSMQQLIDPSFYKKKLSLVEDEKLWIIIDTRQMKDQGQKSFFQEALGQKYKLSVMTQALTIGDFVLCYNGQILDYVIERKKADDLASSIIDGRYKQQKYRLKNSGATNIIYLYQGHPSQSSALREKQLESALIKTRVNDGFKVVKTSKINETVKFLANLYQEVNTKIRNGQELDTIGSLQNFNRRNAKNRYLTVQNVFGFGLKSLPNVGKQTVTNILRYFKSFNLLYRQLQPLANNQDRMEFLNGLLKGGRTQSGVTALIVQLLFSFEYTKSSEKQKKEEK